MISLELFELDPKTYLKEQEYLNVTLVPNVGWCGLHYMLHTVGLMYGMDASGMKGRYCYRRFKEAAEALAQWNGEGDPPGNWIVRKDHEVGEYPNPNKEPE